MTIWRKRIACWIPKAKNTHSEYVIRFAFPLQQWLHERASMLRYTYIACLVYFSFFNFPPFLFPFFLPLIFPFFLDSFLTSQDFFHEEIKWFYVVNSYRYHFVLPVVLYRRKNWSLALIEDV